MANGWEGPLDLGNCGLYVSFGMENWKAVLCSELVTSKKVGYWNYVLLTLFGGIMFYF